MEQKNKEVAITIDGQQVKVAEGTTILNVARQLGIDIPTLCYHSEVSPFGACRLCSVEITKHGRTKIVTSCNYPAEEGLVVATNSDKVFKVRKGVLSLLMARCPKSVKLKNLGRLYGIDEHGLWESNADEDCILCGLCVRVCKELIGVSAINFARRGVEREVTAPYHRFSDDCVGCGACALVCPTGSKKIRIHTYATVAPLKGARDENFGVHIDMFSAKSKNGADNIVNALLSTGFENHLFDTVIFTKKGDGCAAAVKIAQNTSDIANEDYAPFLRIKMISTLQEVIDQGKRKIAFIGLPCQVRAVRKIQQTLQQEIPDLDITTIGLFCLNSFNPKKLREQIKNILNVDIDKASRTQVYGNKFIVTVDGKDFSCDIEKLESAIENGCSYCNDFVANFADVAVGTAGSESPYYTVIVRTEKGVALLEKTPLTKTSVMKDDIVKLSEFKKNRAKDHIEPILREVHAQRSKEKKVN